MTEYKKDIIDEIFDRSHVMYVSDLHDKREYFFVLKAVKEIDENAYSERQWKEAFNYIANTKRTAQTYKEDLMMFLSR